MEQFIILFNEELVVDGSIKEQVFNRMAFSHTISLENVKQVTKDSRPPPPNFQWPKHFHANTAKEKNY